VALGRVTDGAALFDEVMIAVTSGEVTPIIAGTVYCSVISACFEMLDLRRAQGMMAEPARGHVRTEVLSAAVDIFLASGDLSSAERAADQLRAMATTLGSLWAHALAASAEGSVHLSSGRPRDALVALRDAATTWEELHVGYEAARVRVLLGRACNALGDAEGARMEWEAATLVFRACGAAPELAAIEELRLGSVARAHSSGGTLTSRELEVLRLVARGQTNRAIAAQLNISEKTVARHISNIFTKLDVSTRAAATAYAFTHRLVS
jgi:DNA-binding CsgD family transcriptional regulator